MFRKLTMALLCLIISVPAIGADVTVVPSPSTPTGRLTDRPHLLISGPITGSDIAKVRGRLSLLQHFTNSTTGLFVLFNSPGGEVDPALAIGRLLRNVSAWTIVDQDAVCNSACVFAFAGGVERNVFLNGKIGIRRPRFDYQYFSRLSQSKARLEYKRVVEKLERYLNEMGIDSSVATDMLIVPSQKIKYVSREYLKETGLVGTDPAWAEWRRAREIQSQGESHVKAMDQMLDCYNSNTPNAICDLRYEK